MKEKIERISVSLPKSILDVLDKEVIEKNYSSRSEYIRDLIRERDIDENWDKKEDAYGVLVIIYDHHKRELSQKMLDIQHNTLVNIVCSTHIHIDHHNCLEVIILRGLPKIIVEISNYIAGLNGVKFAKLVKTANINF